MNAQYADHTESEVSWIGDMPRGWKVKKFRHLFDESSEKIETEVVGQMLSVSGYRGVEVKAYDDDNRKRLDEELVGYRIVRQGQLVVNTMWLNYAGLGVSSFEGHVSPAYRAYNFSDNTILSRPYAHYLLRSSIYVQGYTQLLTGVRPNSLQMSRDDLMNFPILLPPLHEQNAIAAFLNHQTAKIDALVEDKKRLIELLKEKRQAVISHAVTKGLNPDATMKDSGIEWLGKLPEHWKVKRLKHLVPTITVGIVVEPSKYYREEGVSALRSLNVQPGYISHDNMVFISEEANELHSKSKLQTGDLVVVRTGQPGTTAVIPPELDGSNCVDLIIVKKPSQGSEQYLFWYLNSTAAEWQFSEGSGGAIQQHFNVGTASALVVTFPPPGEQVKIAAFLHEQTKKFDTLMAEAQSAVRLLQERRSALISAAVIGKIDVRDISKIEDAA